MKTVKVNAYAKVNLFLDVVGAQNGYHNLDTVVASISLCDTITISKRKDNKITTVMRSQGFNGVIRGANNNATKAANAFLRKANVNAGVDISITKRIPIGGGLGGSSADIAGTLLAMQRLFETNLNLKEIADEIGSDSGYMLKGGWARLQGRGDKVTPLDNVTKKLQLLIVHTLGGAQTADCFKAYDDAPLEAIENGANRLIDQLLDENAQDYGFYNALFLASCSVNPQIKNTVNAINAFNPKQAFMSGSGSSICAIFDNTEQLDLAFKGLKEGGFSVFKVQTLTTKEVSDNLFN